MLIEEFTMESNYLLNGADELDSLETNMFTTEMENRKHLKLILGQQHGETLGDELSFSEDKTSTQEKQSEPSDEDEEVLYADLQNMARSSLAIYFKSINKYPLLDEDTERGLAKLIKKCEAECKGLIGKWRKLLRGELIGLSPVKQVQDVKSRVKELDASFKLFDEILVLEKEWKKVNRLLKKASGGSAKIEQLQDELNKIEADISKAISKVHLEDKTINAFIKQVKKIPCLKRYEKRHKETEISLRKALRDIEHITTSIKTYKNQLVEANLRLVISIAKKYMHHGVTLPDLIQEGNLGLIRAIDTYDYRRGHRLVTYATWWIRQAMIRAIDCQSKTVRTPVYVNEKINQIVKASNKLFQEFNREPSLDELSQETTIPTETIEKIMQNFKKDYIPLDVLIDENGEQMVGAPGVAEDGSIADRALSSHLSAIINERVLSDLSQREQEIIKLRFGIGQKYDHTLEEIGQEFNLSRERIRQILELALHKIRAPKQMMLLKDFVNPN
jgi:RNA polymerase primary sigma factor